MISDVTRLLRTKSTSDSLSQRDIADNFDETAGACSSPSLPEDSGESYLTTEGLSGEGFPGGLRTANTGRHTQNMCKAANGAERICELVGIEYSPKTSPLQHDSNNMT